MGFGSGIASVRNAALAQSRASPFYKRYVNGQTGNSDNGTVVGNLKANPHNTSVMNWEYWSYAPETSSNWNRAGGWDITTLKGKWQISVKYANNTTPRQFPAYFKIDKRSQIVETARNWFDTTAVELSKASGTGSLCGDFTAMIYNQLGLGALASTTGVQYDQMTRNDNGDGAILFYRIRTNAAAPFDPSHAAIRHGNARININSNTLAHQNKIEGKGYNEMKIQPETIRQGVGPDLLGQNSQRERVETEGYADDIKSSSSVDLDAD